MFKLLAAPSQPTSLVSPLEKEPQTTTTSEDAATPHFLQLRRRRRLSVHDNRVKVQRQSPFFKLPPEIRIIIYKLVLGKNVLRVDQCRTENVFNDLTTEYRHCICSGDGPHTTGFRNELWRMLDTHMPTDQLLGLPLTCRMIYIEAIDVLYTCNRFDLRHTDTLAWLPARLKWLPTSRMHAVRSLSLSAAMKCPVRPRVFTVSYSKWNDGKVSRSRYWAETCRALEALEGLQDLRITVLLWKGETLSYGIPFLASRRIGKIDEESVYWLLFPLKRVMLDPLERRTVEGRVLETTFRVVVNAEVGPRLRERLGPVPFQIERRDYPALDPSIPFFSY